MPSPCRRGASCRHFNGLVLRQPGIRARGQEGLGGCLLTAVLRCPVAGQNNAANRGNCGGSPWRWSSGGESNSFRIVDLFCTFQVSLIKMIPA